MPVDLMLASIVIGVAALMAVSLSAALLLFAHLTGRISRATTLGVAAVALITGGALVSAGAMGNSVLEPSALPFGVCLMLAAGINGLLAYQAPTRALRR